MKNFLMLIYSFSVLAQDIDQKVDRCGKYEVRGKLNCQSIQKCFVDIEPGKLSKIKVKITKSPFSLSYFSNSYVRMNMQINKKGKIPEGVVLSAPVKDIRTFKTTGLKILKRETCNI